MSKRMRVVLALLIAFGCGFIWALRHQPAPRLVHYVEQPK